MWFKETFLSDKISLLFPSETLRSSGSSLRSHTRESRPSFFLFSQARLGHRNFSSLYNRKVWLSISWSMFVYVHDSSTPIDCEIVPNIRRVYGSRTVFVHSYRAPHSTVRLLSVMSLKSCFW